MLKRLGRNIRLARLRRNIPVAVQAKRAGICAPTLTMIEKGSPTVLLSSYIEVLTAMGLEKDLAAIAANDKLGQKIQDKKLLARRKVSGK